MTIYNHTVIRENFDHSVDVYLGFFEDGGNNWKIMPSAFWGYIVVKESDGQDISVRRMDIEDIRSKFGDVISDLLLHRPVLNGIYNDNDSYGSRIIVTFNNEEEETCIVETYGAGSEELVELISWTWAEFKRMNLTYVKQTGAPF